MLTKLASWKSCDWQSANPTYILRKSLPPPELCSIRIGASLTASFQSDLNMQIRCIMSLVFFPPPPLDSRPIMYRLIICILGHPGSFKAGSFTPIVLVLAPDPDLEHFYTLRPLVQKGHNSEHHVLCIHVEKRAFTLDFFPYYFSESFTNNLEMVMK